MTGLFGANDNIPGTGLLQRLDPRLKLILLLSLVITIFSVSDFGGLFCVGFAALGLLVWQPSILGRFLRRLVYLRWLLLFTLMLHLFLTPGRTLFGLRMLSYDGLLRGMMVDLQLSLALFFTLCLGLFTAPMAVAWGAERLLRPLQRLGLPVSESGALLVLVLYFLPQVFQQGGPLVRKIRQQEKRGLVESLHQLARLVGDMVLALVEQADSLARDICRGESPLIQNSDEFRWRWTDSLCLVSGLLFIALCWSI
jgi:energy-coupling factor transport system permease protein